MGDGWAVEQEELPDGGGCDLRCGLARVGDAPINRPCTLPAVPPGHGLVQVLLREPPSLSLP